MNNQRKRMFQYPNECAELRSNDTCSIPVFLERVNQMERTQISVRKLVHLPYTDN